MPGWEVHTYISKDKCLLGTERKSWGQRVGNKGKMKDSQENRRTKKLIMDI